MKFTSEEFDKILSEPYPTGTVWEFPAILYVYREVIKELEQQNTLLRVAFKKNKMKNKKLVKVLEKISALELNKNTCNSAYLAIKWAGLVLEEIEE